MITKFDNTIPIYLQIMQEIKIWIVAGKLKAGEKMASVRELASLFEVNPNTMQRALTELERENLLYTERTSGRFITVDEGLIMNIRDNLAEQELKKFISYMNKIGYNSTDIIQKIQKIEKGEKKDE